MRRTAFLVVCLVFLVGAPAGAQPTVSVRGNVGAAFFQSPEGLNSVLNSGVDLGVGLDVRLYEGFGLILEGAYDRFTLNGENVALFSQDLEVGPSSSVEGGHYTLLNATVGLRYVYRNPSDAHPYLSGGVGLYRTAFSETKVFQSGQLVQEASGRASTNLGFHVALGIDFRIDDTYSFFFEPRFVVVYTDGQELGIGRSTRFVPVRLGLDVQL